MEPANSTQSFVTSNESNVLPAHTSDDKKLSSIRVFTKPYTSIPEKNIKHLTQNDIFYKKALCLEHIQEQGDPNLFMFCSDKKGSDKSVYKICFALNYDDVLYHITTKNLNWYEYIHPSTPVKLFIDIDYKTKEYRRIKLNKILNKIIKDCINLVKDELEKVYGITNPETIILKSNLDIKRGEQNKPSSHVIFSNVMFDNIDSMKMFISGLKSELITNEIFDINPYKVGCLRLLYCAKLDKRNKLQYDRSENYEYNEDMIFYDSCVTYKVPQKQYTYIENKEIIDHIYKSSGKISSNINKKVNITVKKNTSTNFFYSFTKSDLDKLQKCIDDIDNDYLDCYKKWSMVTHAFKDLILNINNTEFKKKIKDIWINWSKKNDKYDKNKNEEIYNNTSFNTIDANFIPFVAENNHRFVKTIKYEYITPLHI